VDLSLSAYSTAQVAINRLFQGGIRAVIWNDVFQAVIMLGGLLTVVIVGTTKVGGASRVITVLQDNNRTDIR
jgi:Na+/proline symporter